MTRCGPPMRKTSGHAACVRSNGLERVAVFATWTAQLGSFLKHAPMTNHHKTIYTLTESLGYSDQGAIKETGTHWYQQPWGGVCVRGGGGCQSANALSPPYPAETAHDNVERRGLWQPDRMPPHGARRWQQLELFDTDLFAVRHGRSCYPPLVTVGLVAARPCPR